MTCTASDTAIPGQYTNTGTATGHPPGNLSIPSAEDDSHYFGVLAALSIEKWTNGQDADQAPGPYVEVGEAISWTYIVTTSVNISLTDVTVIDDHGVSVSCQETVLFLGQRMVCTASGIAGPGQYTNLGIVTGTPSIGPIVEASDASHYYGSVPGIEIEKYTNDEDAETPTGPIIVEGHQILWEYVITNTGNVPLTNVIVLDDQEVTVSCPQSALDPGESMTCTADGEAVVGQYSNLGTVTASPPVGDPVEADDPSHYLGVVDTFFLFLPALSGD
jgi:hypothetical protein